MADKSLIEWTDATWNPITGCSIVSPGCTNCYAMKLAGTRQKHHWSRIGLTVDSKAGPVWNGEVRLNEEWLDQPLRWRRPRRIFVCAHGDLFHPSVPDSWIDRVFAIMMMAPQHTFQVLTKRPERMLEYFTAHHRPGVRGHSALNRVQGFVADFVRQGRFEPNGFGPVYPADWKRAADRLQPFPLPNVALGTSVENDHWAQVRIPFVLETPAAVRFISAEPLLGPIDLEPYIKPVREWSNGWQNNYPLNFPKHQLDWVIVGGESGDGARPMHPDWVRSLRDQCAAAGVAFFFKQWGEFAPRGVFTSEASGNYSPDIAWPDGSLSWGKAEDHGGPGMMLSKVGKKAAGRLLDGVEHSGMPK